MSKANKLNEALKLILQLLHETEDKENKYYLVQAHNYLMKVMLDEK